MAIAGWKARIELSDTPAALSGEAMSVVSGTTYQITNAAKRVLDPFEPIVVYDGASPIASTDYAIDYLFGRVVLDSAPAGAVTIDATYLPLVQVGCAREFALNLENETPEATCFQPDASVAARKFIQGLKHASGSIGYLGQLDAIYDGDTKELVEHALRDPESDFWVLSIDFDGTHIWRGFVTFESHEATVEIADLLQSTVNWVTARPGLWSEI